MVAYSLAGDLSSSNRRSSTGGPVESPFPWEDELALQEAVVDSVLAGPQPMPLGFIDGLEASLQAMWAKRRKETEETKPGGMDRESGGELPSHQQGGVKESPEGGGEAKRRTEGEENEGGWAEANDGWDADWGVDEDDPPGPASDEEAYDEVRLRLEVKDRVEEVFSKLRLVAAARQRLHGFRYLDQAPGALGATTTGLLKQLVAKICAREEIPGLEHAASAVKKLLQTGLGRFGFQNFQSGPKPGDCKVVLVFVVGGLTLGEVRFLLPRIVVGLPFYGRFVDVSGFENCLAIWDPHGTHRKDSSSYLSKHAYKVSCEVLVASSRKARTRYTSRLPSLKSVAWSYYIFPCGPVNDKYLSFVMH